jgi:hypothetical protein
MVQPRHGGDPEASETRLSRFIAEHIARGNKADFAGARQKLSELESVVSGLEPLNMTEEQIEDLVREHCRRGGE